MLEEYKIGIQLIRTTLDELEKNLEEENIQNTAMYYMQFVNFCNMYNTLLGKKLESSIEEKKQDDYPEILTTTEQ